MKAREYAESIKEVHGGNAKVSWMTVDELLDLYDKLDRTQNMLDQATTFDEPEYIPECVYEQDAEADERDLRDTIRSIISEFHPY